MKSTPRLRLLGPPPSFLAVLIGRGCCIWLVISVELALRSRIPGVYLPSSSIPRDVYDSGGRLTSYTWPAPYAHLTCLLPTPTSCHLLIHRPNALFAFCSRLVHSFDSLALAKRPSLAHRISQRIIIISLPYNKQVARNRTALYYTALEEMHLRTPVPEDGSVGLQTPDV